MLQGGQWEGASSNACSCLLAFLLECISFDFCYCFCVLLLPPFSSVFLANVFQCILFDFCPISVCCCYYCGEKRLVNNMPFFMAMIIMMVMVHGERSSTSLLFWVCEPIPYGYGYCRHRDCNCRGLFFLHYHHGGMTPIVVVATAGIGGRGGGLFPPPTAAVVGEMTPTAVAATARRVAG